MQPDRNALREAVAGVVALTDPDSTAKTLEEIIRETPGLVTPIDSHGAVAVFGKYRYQVSIPKLCMALAALTRPLFDPGHAEIYIGLGLIAALAGIDGAFKRISLDEAAVCEALYRSATHRVVKSSIVSTRVIR